MKTEPDLSADDVAALQAEAQHRRGLYHKYIVERMDGRSAAGEKHEHCAYFVLDLTHDPYATAALRTYADACRSTYPALAADLDEIIAGRNPSA